MTTGSVISFKADRGYGFIRPKDGGDNVYVHISALQASGIAELTPGQRVSYDLLHEDGKVSAVNLALLGTS
jgi:CspA family cold shock protein